MRFCAVLLVMAACVGAAAGDFPQVVDTQKLTVKLSTPAEAAASFKLPPGFRLTLFAGEPDVRQPIGVATDGRDRLWVAENYTYAEHPRHFDPRFRDRIIILEDLNGDGISDKRTVFFDQLTHLTSVEIGFGGVWAMCPPHLLFIPDKDGDDKPDGPPVIVLDGFDIGNANQHNFANGLRWGPDGWLYGRNGISNPGMVAKPGTPKERVYIGPGVWRMHPKTRAVELVCTGTTNPWGHDWTDHGELFVINTVIGHLWHGVHGAHFKRMFGPDANPYTYDLLDQNADHVHWDTREAWDDARKGMSPTSDQAGGGHAHSGMMIYLGDNWPAEYRDQVYTVNLHGHRINRDRLERHGTNYVGKHGQDMLHTSDPWFRGVELIYGADGGVYIADWSDIGECHENDGVHRSSGRIYKVVYDREGNAAAKAKGAKQLIARKPIDVGKHTNEQLVELQVHANDWFVRQARRVLQERADAGGDMKETHVALRRIFSDDADVKHKLRALWALYVTGGTHESWLLEQFAGDSENVRAWIVRLLVDHGQPSSAAIAALEKQAAADKSGLVLLYCASALQRIASADRFGLANALVKRAEFADDRVLPLMLWYGVESAVPAQPAKAVALAASSKVPLVSRYIARRLTQDIAIKPDPVNLLVLAITAEGAADLPVQKSLLEGMGEALRGWRKAPAPDAWKLLQAYIERQSAGETKQLVRELSVVFGDGRAVDELMKMASSRAFDLSSRESAIRSLAEARADGLAPLLFRLLDEREVAAEAIRGLAVVGDDSTPAKLIEKYPSMYPPAREAMVDALAIRPASASVLLTAIDRGTVHRDQIPVFQIRQMQRYKDARVQELLRKVWPELRPISADKTARIAEFKKTLTPSAIAGGNASAGRALFDKSCAKCHVLFGTGGKIGPDITGSQRSNIDYLLENIVDPSASLVAQFRMTTIVMNDGRVINGVKLSETDQAWEVQTATEKVVVRTEDIETQQETRLSLMPEGQLDLLKPNEIRDLFAYLMSGEQVPLPTASGR